jgi:hypothetical protein
MTESDQEGVSMNCSDRIWRFFMGHDWEKSVDNASSRKSNVAFAMIMLISVAFIAWSQSAWVFGGEMWAEMATNYYRNAASNSWWEKLFATDAGYWPLPQRLIALLVSMSGLPLQYVPYAYTWIALVLGVVLIASFCLPHFRSLVPSDELRALTCLMILLTVDFQSRTFINFTYFAVFFVTAVAGAAIVNRYGLVPKWAWAVPLLLASKPVVLITTPMLVLWAIVAKGRSRCIAFVAIVFAGIQVGFLLVSKQAGVFQQNEAFTFLQKTTASVRYGLGMLGRYTVGAHESISPFQFILVGVLIFALATFVVIRIRGAVAIWILAGLMLIFGNQALNSFAISDQWNVNMRGLTSHPFFRYTLVSFWGTLIVLSGLFLGLTPDKWTSSLRRGAACAALTLWFALSGWLGWTAQLNGDPISPDLYNSQWQQQAPKLGSTESVCIPVNPYGWYIGFDCGLLNKRKDRDSWFGFVRMSAAPGHEVVLSDLPPELADKRLQAFSLVVRSRDGVEHQMTGEAFFELRDGRTLKMNGARKLHQAGGLVYFSVVGESIEANQVRKITVQIDIPVDYGFVRANQETVELAMMWFGK